MSRLSGMAFVKLTRTLRMELLVAAKLYDVREYDRAEVVLDNAMAIVEDLRAEVLKAKAGEEIQR